MRISKFEDYGVILAGELARQYSSGFVNLSGIARKYQISPLFLKRIAKRLRDQKMLLSLEGRHGGYKLSKNPGQVSVWDIVSALSDGPAFLPCIHAQGEVCPKESYCNSRNFWQKTVLEFVRKLQKISLEEMIN